MSGDSRFIHNSFLASRKRSSSQVDGTVEDSAPSEEDRGTGGDGEQRGGYPQAHARAVLPVLPVLSFLPVLAGLVVAIVIAAVSAIVARVATRHAGLLDRGSGLPVGFKCLPGLGATVMLVN